MLLIISMALILITRNACNAYEAPVCPMIVSPTPCSLPDITYNNYTLRFP
jgi:hypothetical protein